MTINVSQLMFQEAMDNYECGFSYEGSMALFDYLEELEAESGIEMELDPIAIRCDFTEFDDVFSVLEDYGLIGEFKAVYDVENMENADNLDMIDFLEGYTEVITLEQGVIIQNF